MNFILQDWNWVWFLLAVVSGVILFVPRFNGGKGGKGGVSPQDAVFLINKEKAVVIDVRPLEQFEAGHIVNARNIALTDFQSDNIQRLPKNKKTPIIVTCLAGVHAHKAQKPLKDLGYESLYFLTGGINSWVKADLPLVSGPEKKPKKST